MSKSDVEVTINFSCSDLVKRSAKQICYLRNNAPARPEASPRMLEGNKAAQEQGSPEYKEMRGTYAYKNLLLHYCLDEIVPATNLFTLIEYKHISGSIVKDWYLESSILQTALYHSLAIENSKKDYYTATFYRKEGNLIAHLLLDKPLKSLLHMGKNRYWVEPTDTARIVKLFARKAEATLDYSEAQKWDNEFKFREYQKLHKYIKACLIK